MSTVFFIASIIGLGFVVNAIRPIPGVRLAIGTFFGGWLTDELAPHILVVHVITVSAFVANGAVAGWEGWAGLGVTGLTAVGLVFLIRRADRAGDACERALTEVLGDDYRSCIVPPRSSDYDLSVPWRELVFPFAMSHPDVERIRNIPYADGGKRTLLDVYRRKSAPTDCPTLLQVHGGGWMIGNKDQQGRPLMVHLASKGWVCFAPNYPLSPKATWPEHVIALKRALVWVRTHGRKYGANPDFIVVTGGSAGGHLSSLLALTANDPRFQPGFEEADTSVGACVPYYGVYDLTNELGLKMAHERRRFLERFVFKAKMDERREIFESASPISHVSPDDPPFFVIHGEYDSLVPVDEARAFVDGLRAVSENVVCYAEVPGAQHAFDVFPSIRTAHVIKAVERFCDHAYCTWLEAKRAEQAS